MDNETRTQKRMPPRIAKCHAHEGYVFMLSAVSKMPAVRAGSAAIRGQMFSARRSRSPQQGRTSRPSALSMLFAAEERFQFVDNGVFWLRLKG